MKMIDILGKNRFESWTKKGISCRGIVEEDNKILLSYETYTEQYLLPGGGVEMNESLEECCCREIAEETGFLTDACEQYLIMNEYYEEYLFETHFYICKVIGTTERNLTEREKRVGMVPRWVDMQEALHIFSKHQEYAETDEEKRGIYLREYTALKEYVEYKRK